MIKFSVFLLSLAVGLSGFAKNVPEDEECLECTSWFAFSNLTQNNTNILHKNRDSSKRHILPIKNNAGSPRIWIGLGNRGEAGGNPCMGMNGSGLLAVVNAGMRNIEHGNPKGKMHTPNILRDVLTNCDTAVQALARVEKHRTERQYCHGKNISGSTFIFMDLKEAYIVEMTADRRSVTRYDHGYAYCANLWHTGDILETTEPKPSGWLNSACREFMVIQDMNRALRANGKVTVFDMIDMARDSKKPKDFPGYVTLCNGTTNSASTLEAHLTYPDVLSTGYFFIGPPRHTICVPVPICTEGFLPSMTDETWVQSAWKRFDKLKFNAPLPPEFPEFEKTALPRYKAAQAEAEKLLAAGKKDEAVKLLNSTAKSIWLEAEKIIQKHAVKEKKMVKKH